MALSEEERVEFVNQVGTEAFELIVKRLEVLGELPLRELFPSVVGAANVCLANVLRAVIERSDDRAAVADSVVTSSVRQLRTLLEPIITPPAA